MVESLPVHVVGPDLQARHMRETHPELRAGDAFLNNSPYHGNSHAADWGLLVPVVDGGGTHRYTVLAKAHLADCGNALPTTYMAGAQDVYSEGALIFPSVKVQEDYRNIDDVARMARARIRVPDMWWGDYLALSAPPGSASGRYSPCSTSRAGGARRLSERLVRVQRAPDDRGDPPPPPVRSAQPGSTTRSRVCRRRRERDPPEVSVDPEAGEVSVDLRDNPDCLPSGANLTEATSRAAAIDGVFVATRREGPGQRRQLPADQGPPTRELLVGIPRAPGELLASDDQPKRDRRCVRLEQLRGLQRRVWDRRVRADPASVVGSGSGD